MKSHQHTIREELTGILTFVGVIWGVFLLSWFLPWLNEYGLRARSLEGLIGVATMPFLHADLVHLVSNTIPLVILLILLAGSRGSSPGVVAAIVLGGGLLLWLFGRNGTPQAPVEHIGASGLVFGLAAFLIASGPFEKRLAPMGVAVLVALLYGFTLFKGVLPIQSGVSWDGHLCGAIAGVAVAAIASRANAAAPAS